MKCPVCGSDVRASKKNPGRYLCDTCRKSYPASAVTGESIGNSSRRPSGRTQERSVRSPSGQGKMHVVHESADQRGNCPAQESARSADNRTSRESARQTSSRSAREPSRQTSSRSAHEPSRQTSSRTSRESARQVKSQTAEKPAGQARNRARKKARLPAILLVLVLLIAAGIVIWYFFLRGALGKNAADSSISDTLYSTGETASYNDICFSVLGYEESAGDEWSSPAEGKIFVFVNMEITNDTEENLSINSMANFESYCGGMKLAYSANAFTALATSTDSRKMDGTIAPGETLEGCLSLEVPDIWESIEVQYINTAWSEDRIRFEVTK